jgi:hypothetical protein
MTRRIIISALCCLNEICVSFQIEEENFKRVESIDLIYISEHTAVEMNDCMIQEMSKRTLDPLILQIKPSLLRTNCFSLGEYSSLTMQSCSVNGFTTQIKAQGSMIRARKCYFGDSIGNTIKLKSIRCFQFD